MNPKVKYLEASSCARWALVILLLVLATIGIFLYQEIGGINIPENATEEELATVIGKFQELARYFTLINFILSLGMCAYFLRLGYRTINYREFPPPETAVILRTKIVEGRMAVHKAIGCFIIGIIVWAGFGVGIYIEQIIQEFSQQITTADPS